VDNLFAILGGAVALVVAIGLAMSLRRVAPDERLIVERFGTHTRTAGPGWTFIVPVIERGILVPLAEFMPAWQAFSEEQLRKKLIDDYYRQVNRPA
jgi:regulator of protease activity HflC (stomatin/prohibitin superfamily)